MEEVVSTPKNIRPIYLSTLDDQHERGMIIEKCLTYSTWSSILKHLRNTSDCSVFIKKKDERAGDNAWKLNLKNGEIIASDVKNKIEVFPHCEFPFCQCTHNHFTRSLLKWKTLHEHKKNLSILIFLFSLARCYLFLNIYRKARCDMRSPLTTAFFFFALFLSLHCQ